LGYLYHPSRWQGDLVYEMTILPRYDEMRHIYTPLKLLIITAHRFNKALQNNFTLYTTL